MSRKRTAQRFLGREHGFGEEERGKSNGQGVSNDVCRGDSQAGTMRSWRHSLVPLCSYTCLPSLFSSASLHCRNCVHVPPFSP